MSQSLLVHALRLSVSLAAMALISSVSDSHTSAKTLDDIRGSSAVYSSPENPELKESSFPLDDAIRINQVGMQPSQAKLVVFAGAQLPGEPRFHIVDERGRRVFAGPLEHFGLDSDSGEELWRGDFTAFRLKGRYRVGISGRGFSYPCEIGGGINSKLVRLATRWLYLQRSGIDLRDSVTGVEHKGDHRTAAFLRDARGIHLNHRIDTSGGWWDAGDYGRYVPPAASTIQLLLYAYHFNPQLFADGTMDIPESGNGVPDLLDEMRWELEWLLKMQRSDGAVHQKTSTRDYAEVPPGADDQPIYLFDVSSQATAEFAGALSEASIVFRNHDRMFARRLVEAAKGAWKWLEENPNKYPVNGFKNPDDENGGDYAVSGDETAQQLWAAAGLFHATGERRFGDAFVRLWSQRDKSAEVYGLSWADGYVFGMFSYLEARAASPDVKRQIADVVREQSQAIMRTIEKTGYRVALHGNTGPFGYQWGSNFLALNYATYLLLANEYVPNASFVNGAAAQLNWLLGVNPMNKSFITGAGANPVRSPHHMLSILRGEAVPGAVTEGPNAMSMGGDPVLKALFITKVPFSKRYADDDGSWATNEPTIYGNAAFIAVASAFSH